jgi:uncharacterized 2Fe-2S/4Fe-4S cluster protein (DUF4445 family)
MAETIRITLHPLDRTIEAPVGASLQDLLFAYGVEFPCGGSGRCKGCRVRVLAGKAAAGPEDRRALTSAEIDAGWRLACHLRPCEDIALEVAQWETAVLGDERRFAFRSREGLGIAVDLGTTTVVAQGVDLATGRAVAVRTALNPQAAFGSDVMSRVECAVSGRDGGKLTAGIRSRIGEMVTEIGGGAALVDVVVVGNTVMHHLFCGLDVEPLSHVPFQTGAGQGVTFPGGAFDWLPESARLRFLPCIGGFVGSDILAGIVATGLHESGAPVCLIDLGTNGEIVVGNRERLLCASTAAGPAFEGGRISMGMRAATGAISQVRCGPNGLRCHVLGDVPPRGICGSGLVDAVAVGLELGVIAPNGRLANGPWTVQAPVALTQEDVRQLQLAKAAIAAGVRVLLGRLGWTPGDISRVHLAGAFGNYVSPGSACRIGLLPFGEEVVSPAGNTALLGAKLALFDDDVYAGLGARIEHVSLAQEPAFQEAYVEELGFPASAVSRN